MFTNDDKQFLSDLNDKLASSFSKAMGAGPSPGANGDGSAASKDNTQSIKENTRAQKLGSAALKVYGLAFTTGVNLLGKTISESNAFGNALAKSSIATGRSMSLMGAKFDSSTKQFTNQMPPLSAAFKEFGIAPREAAKILDNAIRANVRDTGKTSQRFLATSNLLGNNLSTTSKFLTTQTNVLGLNTEATTTFGHSILAMASSNGILADSIFEAVNAFTDTAKEQQVFFGKESTKVTTNAVAAMKSLIPEQDVGAFMAALTSSDVVKQLPMITGQLGIPMIGNLDDPANMQRLIESAIPALAQMGQGLGGDLASIERQKAFARIAPIFQPKNIQIAMRFMEELQASGQGIGYLSKQFKLSDKAVGDAAGTLTRTSDEALKGSISFGAFERAIQGTRLALDDLNAAILDTPDNVGKITQQFVRLTSALDFIGISIATVLGVALGPKAIGALGRRLLPGAAGAAGGASTAGRVAASTAAASAMTRPQMIAALTPKQMAKYGITVSPTGYAGISKEGAKLLGQGSRGTLTTKSLEKLMAQSARGGALKGVARVAGKAAAPLAGTIAGVQEYRDSGDVSRAVTRGAAETGGVLASMAVGAAIGSAVPVIGTIGGGIIGGLASFFTAPMAGDAAVAAHDALGFYDDQEMIGDINTPVAESQNNEALDLQRSQTELLEGIFQNTLGTNVAGEESPRFRFSTPPEWRRSSGGFFTSPTQR